MKLAIFDIDGTLVRSGSHEDGLFWHALSEILGVVKEPFDWTEFEHVTDSGITGEVFRRQFGRKPSLDALAATERFFAELWRDTLRAFSHEEVEVPGAGLLLEKLDAHPQWQTAVATGGWGLSARAKLTAAGIAHEALSLGCANDAIAREEIIAVAHDRARSVGNINEFERVVYVGDGSWDVKTCANLKMPLVGIAVAPETRDRLNALGVSHVLDDYRDTDAVFAALEAATAPHDSR
ncbi:HAD family hydrolase [Pelagibius sp. Alg239-R121]|uniref:HAD family hydrolase n=1 Tax=Pelagibius sp. Alg239-R121 TaxID=2993448 RepID=UPI0024A64481|nr:HAD family hydrolase [Pelagibius sp. Alg239-R121]